MYIEIVINNGMFVQESYLCICYVGLSVVSVSVYKYIFDRQS